jgi:hypothetical protein
MKKFLHYHNLAGFLESKMFQIKIVEKMKRRYVTTKIFFFRNRGVYEIISKNVVESEDADDMAPARGILDK